MCNDYVCLYHTFFKTMFLIVLYHVMFVCHMQYYTVMFVSSAFLNFGTMCFKCKEMF